MNIKELFGMENEPEEAPLNINMTNVTLPMDMALQLIFRQQQQLFSLISGLQDQINITDQVVSMQGEKTEHLHKDIIEVQQVIESASKHPVEKTDDETEQKTHKKDERPN